MFNKGLRDKVAAFIGGFSFTTIDTWLHTIPFLEIIEKIITTGIIGFVGGVAGLLSQDLYRYLKGKVRKERSNE